MKLKEFSDPQTYTLSADDSAAVLKRLERMWREFLRLTQPPRGGRRKLLDAV
jgi:hypothetical protein